MKIDKDNILWIISFIWIFMMFFEYFIGKDIYALLFASFCAYTTCLTAYIIKD